MILLPQMQMNTTVAIPQQNKERKNVPEMVVKLYISGKEEKVCRTEVSSNLAKKPTPFSAGTLGDKYDYNNRYDI